MLQLIRLSLLVFILSKSFISSAFAVSDSSEPQRFPLSKTSEISWSGSLSLKPTLLPSVNGIWFLGQFQGKPVSLWVSRSRPSILTNHFTVGREWQEILDSNRNLGFETQELGCKTLSSSRYRCEMESFDARQKESMSKIFYWNGTEDFILIQVKSSESSTFNHAVLGSISIQLK